MHENTYVSPHNMRVLPMTTQESSCSRKTGERIQMLQSSLEVEIAHICEIPLQFFASAHTFASSVNNDKETEHSHESEGLEKCEVCVQACVSAMYILSTWQQKLNIASAQQDHASYCLRWIPPS